MDPPRFARAAQVAGVPDATPYPLRHSFCSLLLAEGRSVIGAPDGPRSEPDARELVAKRDEAAVAE